jgi:leader peptidase (prepilin peptidase)/N-methyltransferase
VHAVLVASCAVIGLAVGAVLDPVGQHLAVRSRAAEELHRLERADRRPGEPAADGETEIGRVDPDESPDVAAVADANTAIDGTPPVGQVRHLLPEGRSAPRTVGAAVVSGALFALAAGHYGTHLVLVPFLTFLAVSVTVSITDLTHRLVPRQLLYGALALIVPLLVVVSAQSHAWSRLGDAAVAGSGAFVVFFLIWFFVPRGMGFGDVRLSGVIGVTVGYLGLLHAYMAFLVGFVLGLVFGLVLMLGSSAGRKTRIPFAPALCVGAVVTILWGDPLVDHLFHAGT